MRVLASRAFSRPSRPRPFRCPHLHRSGLDRLNGLLLNRDGFEFDGTVLLVIVFEAVVYFVSRYNRVVELSV